MAAPSTARNAMTIDARSSRCITVLAGNVVVGGGAGTVGRVPVTIVWLVARLESRSRRILRSSA
jgi:cytidylate kinase